MRRTTEINNEVRSLRNRSRKPRYQRLSKEEGATGARDNILFIRVTSFCACLPKIDSNKFGSGNYASVAFGTIISLRSARRCRKCGERHNTLDHPIGGGTSSTTNSTRKAMGNSEESSGPASRANRSDQEAKVGDSTSGESVPYIKRDRK